MNACGRGTGNGDVVQLGGAGATAITLNPSLGAIPVTSSMTIQGNYQNAHRDYNTVTISTTGAALLQVPGGLSKDVTLTMQWLRLTGAHGNSAYGGCIAVNGAAAGHKNTTNLTTVQLDHCSAWSGGAVYSVGDVNITSSSLHDNHASYGGAVAVDGLSGGLGYLLHAKSTTFSSNAADQNGNYGQGGAVLILGGPNQSSNDFANIVATGCTFSDNRAPYGAAAYTFFGHVEFYASTFESNTAIVDGGGLYIKGGGGVLMTNDTFAKNSAVNLGGGIYFDGSASYWEVSHITVAQNTAGNRGGGLYQDFIDGTTFVEGNSIFAYNSAPTGPNLSGDFTWWGSDGTDFVSDASGATTPQHYSTWWVTDPQLGNLQSVNGLPKVYPLLPGSLAIDASGGAGLTYDEEGAAAQWVVPPMSAPTNTTLRPRTPS